MRPVSTVKNAIPILRKIGLIATTLAGDVIVMNASTLTEVWRTHVPGGAGYFNSIRVLDLDDDTYKELYVAGSLGMWRFVQPSEFQSLGG